MRYINRDEDNNVFENMSNNNSGGTASGGTGNSGTDSNSFSYGGFGLFILGFFFILGVFMLCTPLMSDNLVSVPYTSDEKKWMAAGVCMIAGTVTIYNIYYT